MFSTLDIPTLLNRIKTIADLKNSEFNDDEALKAFIQEAYDEVYSDLTTQNRGYFVSAPSEITSDDNARVQFPEDYYKLVLLEVLYGSRGLPLDRVGKRQGSRKTGYSYNSYYDYYAQFPFGYAIFDNYLQIYPENTNRNRKFRITYNKNIPAITSGTIQKGWEHYLSYQAAYLARLSQDDIRPGIKARADDWRRNIMKFSEYRDNSSAVLPGAGESGVARGNEYW